MCVFAAEKYPENVKQPMCGIAGRFNFRSGAPIDPNVIQRMTDLLGHRGPNDEGAYIDGPIALGHRRLSVVDVSAAGHQPMCTRDGRLWITFNGEIYNFKELRRELEGLGHFFVTQTDTEVILEAYREFGGDCLSRLRGMFAFAIWDSAERSLMLARDRIGKKPLYYRLDEDGIEFVSEPKAFLANPGFSPEPDIQALSAYLTYQYVPSPLSAFKGVKKLAPAHSLLVQDGTTTIRRYWHLDYGAKRHMTEDEACERVLATLREAVRLRLISDVPLGAFLSGGIDSATVVALMSELAPTVETFSIGFEEQDFDELRYARAIADRFRTVHHEFVVRPDVEEVLPQLAWYYGEPFADGSAIPMYYLAKVTRDHVTVALTGDGGDETFAGYERYVSNAAPTPYQRLPHAGRRIFDGGIRMVSGYMHSPSIERVKRLWQEQSEPRELRYVRWMSHFTDSQKADLCRPEFLEAAGNCSSEILLDAFRASTASDYVDATLDVDTRSYLPDDLLVKVDIASMAHGLEARSPFLDHVLMELAASLPAAFKLRGAVKKYVLKRSVSGLLPPETIHRPKMGFAAPLRHWFRRELKELAHDILLSDRMAGRGYFSIATVRRLLDEHTRSQGNHENQLFNLLMLELWHRRYIDAGSAREIACAPARDAAATLGEVGA